MKNRLFKCALALIISLLSLPLTGQDWMEIHFKDGTYRTFYMENVTEFKTTKVDVNGVVHSDYAIQRVVTQDDIFEYPISEIDSIAFTKYDSVVAKQNLLQSLDAIFDVLKNNETIEEVVNHLDEIKASKAVKDVWINGDQMYVYVYGYGSIPFLFANKDIGSNEKAVSRRNVKSTVTSKNNYIANGNRLKAVIANQVYYDKKMEYEINNFYPAMQTAFEESGITCDYVTRPNIGFFYDNSIDPEKPNMYDYDIIFIDTHGGYDEKTGRHDFATSEILCAVGKEQYYDPYESDLTGALNTLQSLRIKYGNANSYEINATFIEEWDENGNIGWICHPIIYDDFFKYRAKGKFKNPNSILFITACNSLEGNTMHTTYASIGEVPADYALAHALRIRNLGVYLGYNYKNWVSPYAATYFYMLMTKGYSLDKACYALPEILKANENEIVQEDDEEGHGGYCIGTRTAYLMRVPDLAGAEFGNVFIVPVYSNEISQAAVNTQYYKDKTVTLEGFTTSSDITLPECEYIPEWAERTNQTMGYGFRYKVDNSGATGTLQPQDLDKVIDAELIPMSASSELGNRKFTAQLGDLELGTTVYYCAYTYDGMNYNYGDILSFYIEKPADLSLSTQQVTLTAHTTTTVDILSGSDNYDVTVEDPMTAAAVISESKITIKGLSEGPTVVTVKDNVSLQTAEINVTVNAPDPSEKLHTYTVNGVSFTMVDVEGGTFAMGASTSDSERYSNERPQHVVSLSNFAIGQTEVTQELWNAVMGTNPSTRGNSVKHPVERVSWDDCQDFVSKLNELTGEQFRLPTEAEWEFAARGGLLSQGYKYSGSNTIDDVAWYADNANDSTHAVASKQPNELGLYDMTGNVYEWVSDTYGTYSSSAQVNPTGATSGDKKVYRGGSWYSTVRYCRNTYRNGEPPTGIYSNFGLRLAMSSNSDERFSQVIPDEIFEQIEQHMPIFDGSNPPNIEGEYLASPFVMVYDVLDQFEVGHQFNDLYVKFYNQDMVNNTLDLTEKSTSSSAVGTGSFISGDGTHFTVYFNIEGVTHYDYDITWKEAIIISGTMTSSGIANFFYSFVLLEKSDDPYPKMVDVGHYRVFKDKDGSSPYYNWYGSSAPLRAPSYNMSLPDANANDPNWIKK